MIYILNKAGQVEYRKPELKKESGGLNEQASNNFIYKHTSENVAKSAENPRHETVYMYNLCRK